MQQRVRVINQPWRGHQVGDELDLPQRDARFLEAYKRVEVVEDAAPQTFEDMTKDELVAEAEKRGLTVARSDGKDGEPLKADYLKALTG